MSEEIIHINPLEVTFITKRDRDRGRFELMKDSIRQIGQRTILKVQDITNWKPEKRRRPDGGLYKWRAAFGQGRCEAGIELYEETKDRAYLRIPAKVVKSAESELAGMSMTENMLRKDYSLWEQARLMKQDVEQFTLEQVATGYCISLPHLKKVLGVLNKLNPKLEKQLKSLTLDQAASLTSLPQASQAIVLDVMHDEGLRSSQVPALVRKARELTEKSPELSKSALKASLRRVNEDLKRARESVKPLRLHFEIGSQNVYDLLTDPKHKHIRTAIDAAGINVARFLEVMR